MPAKPMIADPLLAWYDVHRRDLPWRAAPGAVADPYAVWLSEIMLQQTTVAAVRPRFAAWLARWPSVAALAAADEADVMAAWAGLGYYARARNLIACARAIVALGRFPASEAEWRAMPGIGEYTAAAIAAIALGQRAVVVDANVKRVVARLFAAPPGEVRGLTETITPDARAGDFAQALMDLGATVCTPRRPGCLACPLRIDCAAHANGDPEALPARAAKSERPVRRATIFWLECDGAVLVVRRPPKGMLGAMRALPSGDWGADPPDLTGAPADADWRWLDAGIAHVFTHFRLECRLAAARIDAHTAHAAGEWWPVAAIADAGLPTLFAKAAAEFGRDECVSC